MCFVLSSLPRGKSHSCKLHFSPIYALFPVPSYSLVHGLGWCTREECTAWLKSGYRLFTCIRAVSWQKWGFSGQQPMLLELPNYSEVIKWISFISFHYLPLSVVGAYTNCRNGYELWNCPLTFLMTCFFCYISFIVTSVSENCSPFIIP